MHNVVVAILTLLILSSCRPRPTQDSGSATLGITEGPQAELVDGYRIDLEELSGLVTVPRADGESATILAVGDRRRHVVVMRFADWRSAPEVERIDLRGLVASGHSQWEGVASDGEGRIFVMRENSGDIHVISADGEQLLQTISLDLSSIRQGPEDNSLGEGLALMSNGHILFLKEKDRPCLIEFGPLGEPVAGVSFETLLGAAPFPLRPAARVTFRPLKMWEFGESTQALMTDFSDLAVSQDGHVYVLSDESRRIARLEAGGIGPTDNKAKIVRYWDLPRQIDKPEGLAFIGEHPVVGSDRIGGKNVFVLAKLSE